jgi:tubulin polyglutamylase TTLL9
MELQALKLYLISLHGIERVDQLFWDIQMIMLRSLLAVQPIMIADKKCFELYGYDVIIDANLKPWLLEVNASPSLTANTKEDYVMKTEMLHGMLDIVDMDGVLQGDEEHISGWDLVYDNGFIEIDPAQCNYTTFLGAAVPEPEAMMNNVNASMASMNLGAGTAGASAGAGASTGAGQGSKQERSSFRESGTGSSGSRSRPSTGKDRRGSSGTV